MQRNSILQGNRIHVKSIKQSTNTILSAARGHNAEGMVLTISRKVKTVPY
jgi:hypothetical protein